jgi:hypothetical protein
LAQPWSSLLCAAELTVAPWLSLVLSLASLVAALSLCSLASLTFVAST